MNSIAVEALSIGLGNRSANPDLQEMLGPLVARPATSTYELGDTVQRPEVFPDQASSLWDAFEWTRGDW